MTKTDLIEALVKKLAIPKTQANESIDIILDQITKALSKGDQVTLTGFGTFKVSKRSARTGRNPKTGETLKIPAMSVPKFKAGKGLKDAVR
ncbi:MAG: HU family DNA-binding protein [Candidatus Paceibacterota bacterium]|jgi:DNA-binding protein HU-beta|nr:HU family DNA-binding protein [Candidatus Paceibacterota bacterium]MDD4831149.1 HU family DNA-binding protein [Candidatus Paceibacterota bacterium]MDD4875501.1 HU family DNA-binding protein [Candidatus Paceibacterota bacterium]